MNICDHLTVYKQMNSYNLFKNEVAYKRFAYKSYKQD